MDESEDKRLLLAQAYIEADGGLTLYRPGDLLPSDSPDAAAWVEAGSAIWVDVDYQPPHLYTGQTGDRSGWPPRPRSGRGGHRG